MNAAGEKPAAGSSERCDSTATLVEGEAATAAAAAAGWHSSQEHWGAAERIELFRCFMYTLTFGMYNHNDNNAHQLCRRGHCAPIVVAQVATPMLRIRSSLWALSIVLVRKISRKQAAAVSVVTALA